MSYLFSSEDANTIAPLWSSIGVILFYLGVILAIASRLYHLNKADSELTRKVVHIGTGNVILLAWWLNIPATVAIGAAVVASIIALVSYFLPILPSINSVGRQSLGTFFYAVSIGVLVTCFWQQHPYYTVIGILIMSWGDGMAAIIGQRFGKHQYQVLGIHKSWEGSLAMFVVAYSITQTVLMFIIGNSWQIWLISLLVAAISTVLEAFSKLGIDNLTVPIASAITVSLLLQQFG